MWHESNVTFSVLSCHQTCMPKQHNRCSQAHTDNHNHEYQTGIILMPNILCSPCQIHIDCQHRYWLSFLVGKSYMVKDESDSNCVPKQYTRYSLAHLPMQYICVSLQIIQDTELHKQLPNIQLDKMGSLYFRLLSGMI